MLSKNTDNSSNQSSSSSVVERYYCVDEAYFGLLFSAKRRSLKVSNYNQVLAVIAANEKCCELRFSPKRILLSFLIATWRYRVFAKMMFVFLPFDNEILENIKLRSFLTW